MSKNGKKEAEQEIEITVKQYDSTLNGFADLSMNNSGIRYGPVLTDENCSSRNLNKSNKINTDNNSLSFVSTNSDNNSNLFISVYGVDIKFKKPLRYGKTFAFFHLNDFPLLIIGPKCKFHIIT